MEELKDIRALEPITDINLYLLIVISIFITLIISALLYKLISTIRKKKRDSLRKEVLEKLKSIDLNNPKKAAYGITKYGRFLVQDSQSQEIFQQLLLRVEKYKFKKDVPLFDDETINYYNLFIKSIDE